MQKRTVDIALVLTVLLLLSETAWARGVPMPDGGSSGLLLVLAAVGLGVTRRFLRR